MHAMRPPRIAIRLQLHHRVVKQLERHLARDRVVPSPQHVIAATCLRALTSLALGRDRAPDHAARYGLAALLSPTVAQLLHAPL